MEKLTNIVEELNKVVSKISYSKKKELVFENKDLRHILFERPRHYISTSQEIALFEKKFKTSLSNELKTALNIVGIDGYYFSDFFDYNISSYHPIDAFFSEKFVIKLINNGLTALEIEDGYFDNEYQEFNSEKIAKVYEQSSDKIDLLIHCISFAECCGGRRLLILNGKDKNTIAYDNHVSDVSFKYNEKTYKYVSYIKSDNDQTIFDLITSEVSNTKIKLEPHIDILNKTL